MRLFYLGDPPPGFLSDDWEDVPVAYVEPHLFEVDTLFVFAGSALSARERAACQLIERSGRPVIRIGAVDVPLYRPAMSNLLLLREYVIGDAKVYEDWILSRPRTNYRPIACTFYDRMESAILSGEPVAITYRRYDGETVVSDAVLKNTKTHRSEEFLRMEDNCYLRLDRIVALGGVAAAESCSY
ncbi:hypothetical protein [Lewinella sp. IMCC34183]|uniref:hypothetical protein n=1 Tax=Lewinella sp. IMCC34183 TaxID=2248762 RepID=UPI000E26624D|nr:hypothetical protein [Lewinella sp. IMCC34183]